MNQENDTAKTRAFIAIKVSQELLDFFRTFRQSCATASWAKSVRWLPDENIHLTLRFLGDLSSQQLQAIQQDFPTLANLDPFSISVSQPQPFPGLKKPRMLAALIQKNTSLQQLARAAELLAISAGLTPEKRPFLGHITVARFRRPPHGLESLLKATEVQSMPVRQVALYRSYLEPQGARYEKLMSLELR